LTVTDGGFVSSIMYRIFIEGRARATNIAAGRIVHVVSNSCLSILYLLNLFIAVGIDIMYKIRTVKVIMRIIEWSLKNVSCSMAGEALS
jgi:hypothetical protein